MKKVFENIDELAVAINSYLNNNDLVDKIQVSFNGNLRQVEIKNNQQHSYILYLLSKQFGHCFIHYTLNAYNDIITMHILPLNEQKRILRKQKLKKLLNHEYKHI